MAMPLLAANTENVYCLIASAGPAGLTAAVYLARCCRRFIWVDAGLWSLGRLPL